MRFFLLLFLFQTPWAWGFVNVESLRVQSKPGYSGKLDAKGHFQSGNTSKNLGIFSSLNRYEAGSHEWLGLLNYKYGESFHVKDTHNGQAHFRWAYHLRPSVWSELFAQTSFDEFKALKQRDLFGGGGRFQVLKTSSFFVFSGIGFFAEKEQLERDPDEENLRGNLYLSSVYNREDFFKASFIVYFQPVWDELTDHRLHLDVDMETALNSYLSLLFSYDFSHDNRPPTLVKKNDSLTSVGVRWSIQ